MGRMHCDQGDRPVPEGETGVVKGLHSVNPFARLSLRQIRPAFGAGRRGFRFHQFSLGRTERKKTMHRHHQRFASLFSRVAVGVLLFTQTGCAHAVSEVEFNDASPTHVEKADPDRFPSVEIINVFEPEGESNVRSSFRIADGSALIGTEETGDVFKSTDSGITWRKTTDGGDQWGIQDIREFIRGQDGNIYGTTSEPALILQSVDEGESWQVRTKAQASRTVGIAQLEDGAILAGLRRSENNKTSIVRSADYFETVDWIPVSDHEPRQNVTCFQPLDGSSVLAGVGYEASGKIYKSEDSGRTWRQTGEFEDARDVMAFYREDDEIYVLTSGIATLFVSADEGESWRKAHQFWPKGFIGSTAEFQWKGRSLRVIPGTDQTQEAPRHVVLISDDLGKTWFEWVELKIDADAVKGGGASNLAVIDKDTIIVGVGNHAVQGRCFTLRFK